MSGLSDLNEYPPERLREFIAAQICPYCQRGPFRVLALHTGQAHGVSARQLRDLAFLLRRAPICAAEYSEECRERTVERGMFPPGWEGGSVKPYGPAGRAAIQATAREKIVKILARPRVLRHQCKRGHEFTPENTTHTRSGDRRCKTCDRERRQAVRKTAQECSVDGCARRAAAAKGLCARHYWRQNHHGSTNLPDLNTCLACTAPIPLSRKYCTKRECQLERHRRKERRRKQRLRDEAAAHRHDWMYKARVAADPLMHRECTTCGEVEMVDEDLLS